MTVTGTWLDPVDLESFVPDGGEYDQEIAAGGWRLRSRFGRSYGVNTESRMYRDDGGPGRDGKGPVMHRTDCHDLRCDDGSFAELHIIGLSARNMLAIFQADVALRGGQGRTIMGWCQHCTVERTP